MKNQHKSDNEIASGYTEQQVYFFDKENESISRFVLLLPNNTKTNEMVKELNAFSSTEREKYACELLNLEPVTAESDHKVRKEAAISKPKKKTKIEDINFDEEKNEIEARYKSDLESKDIHCYAEVYPHTEVLKIIENVLQRSIDPDYKKRAFELYTMLKAKGNFRLIARSGADYESTLKSLMILDDTHPHFHLVTGTIRDQLALSSAQRKPLHVPPILLFGPPGVGKTDYSTALAGVIGVPIHRIGFDTGITNSTLTGSASHWGNSTPGVLFEKLVLGDNLNGIVLLDELDKGGYRSGEGRDPTQPLHTILEPSTSKHTADISVGMEFDTSHVIWIATANNPALVSESLRSRFLEFHIDHPSGSDALKLAQTLALKAHAQIGVADLEPVSPQLVKQLAHMTAREQLRALRQAYSAAVANGRKVVEKTDFPAEVFADSDPDSSYLH